MTSHAIVGRGLRLCIGRHGNRRAKRFLCRAVVLFCLLLSPLKAFCSEAYYIEDHRVLLYKMINWWYDCLPEESTRLCGLGVTCRNSGEARVEYNQTQRVLTLRLARGFAEQLSILTPCEQCAGPSYLKCVWLNQAYFGDSAPDNIVADGSPALQRFVFKDVEQGKASRIQKIEKTITFVVKGAVGGLLNGKIALHQAGSFLKTCPRVSQDGGAGSPIRLDIVNSATQETLARYHAIEQR